MPQLTLRYCCIADVCQEEHAKVDSNGQSKDKIVKININEEDFFDVLDHVNPKTIIKYLDLRNIPHRDAMNINFYHSKNSWLRKKDRKKLEKVIEFAENYNKQKL